MTMKAKIKVMFVFMVMLTGSFAVAEVFTVESYKFFCGDYTGLRSVKMEIGQHLMILNPDTGEIEPVGLDGTKWFIGYGDDQGYISGWGENIRVYVEGKEGYIYGSYTNFFESDADQRPNFISITNDRNNDGIGDYDTSNKQWYIYPDDIQYDENDILFGPDRIRGDVSQLPAFTWAIGQLYLPQMIIDVVAPAIVFPSQGAVDVVLDVVLEWATPPGRTFTHDVYFGTDPVALELLSPEQTEKTYILEPLAWGQKYYWRIDEHDGDTIYAGDLWYFTTNTPVTGTPVNNATHVDMDTNLSWQVTTQRTFTHDIYFGTDPENLLLLAEDTSDTSLTIDPMDWATTYYWRIDERDNDTVYPGQTWNFTTIVPTCPTPPPGDVNDDCIVNLADVAIIAANWLTCNLEPADACP